MKDFINDSSLLQRIAESDEQAYYSFFVHYSALIRPYICRITKSNDNADEVIQETFIRVWLNRDKLPEIQNVKSWVFTVASNECIRFMRKSLTYERKLRESNSLRIADADYYTPEQSTLFNDVNRSVSKVVNRMPSQRKLIYLLSREQGMKPAEISEKLSLSVGTVKNVLSATLKEIRKELLTANITAAYYIIFTLTFFL